MTCNHRQLKHVNYPTIKLQLTPSLQGSNSGTELEIDESLLVVPVSEEQLHTLNFHWFNSVSMHCVSWCWAVPPCATVSTMKTYCSTR